MFIFKIKKKLLQFRKFHGLYWATLGFLDTEKANFINYGDNENNYLGGSCKNTLFSSRMCLSIVLDLRCTVHVLRVVDVLRVRSGEAYNLLNEKT